MIQRHCVKKNNEIKYTYYLDGKLISEPNILERIRRLHIPPNWKNVLINTDETDYLQVTGFDDKKIQYIYHPLWNELTRIEKYNRLATFVKKLPRFLKKINYNIDIMYKLCTCEKNMEKLLLSAENIYSLIFRILFLTNLRIGNQNYADENGTYGLTTLLKKHVKISGDKINLSFIGKKKVQQNISFEDKKTAVILRYLIDKKKLEERVFDKDIDSRELNQYLHANMGECFTSKDFRTYGSNRLFLQILNKKLGETYPKNISEAKKIIRQCYEEVSAKLGNTISVCRLNYVMPYIEEIYMKNPTNFYNKKYTLENIFDSV